MLHLWLLMLMRLTHRDATTTAFALFPFLRLTFSLLCVFGRNNGDVAARPSLPPQRQVTKHIKKVAAA
jgi:hypothetical protein